MKKSKLVKLIVFSLLFIFSLVPMITLTSIYSIDPKVEFVSAEVKNIRISEASYGEKYDRFYINCAVRLKNNSITAAESFRGYLYIALNGREIATVKLGDFSIGANKESETNYDYMWIRETMEQYLDGKRMEDLAIEDFDLEVQINNADKEKITPLLIGGLAMIPFIVVFGGLLLYTIFDKRENLLDASQV